jgi:hypothetical protein
LRFCCLGPKDRFSWPENAFNVFRREILVEKIVVRFILGWNFLNKTSNPYFTLGPRDLYGKQRKITILVSFHRRINLIALFFGNFVFWRERRTKNLEFEVPTPYRWLPYLREIILSLLCRSQGPVFVAWK